MSEQTNLMGKNKTSAEIAKLQETATRVLEYAKDCHATAAEVHTSIAKGYSVNVRLGEVDTVEYHHDKGIDITVYFGQRKGHASSSDTDPKALQEAVQAACNIAKYTGEDPYAGLADKEFMAFNYPTLDLLYPWGLGTDEAIELAIECEASALQYDKRIVNSEGCSLTTYQNNLVYANTHGFMGDYTSTRHNVSCVVVASNAQGMQRDYSYTVARDPRDLTPVNQVGKQAAERTIQRLGHQRLSTRKTPILFQAEVARSLIGHFLSAISGGNLYRETSFLVNQLEQPVFNEHVHIYEDPLVAKGLRSSAFDDDGVRTQKRDLVQAGILKGYLLGSYSARKLKMQTTGNAGGAHNVFVETSKDDFQSLIKEMGTGLLVTELMGNEVNILTGNYSRGASGFWVENGEIQFPVQEITIAGNLKDMFKQIRKIGNDIDMRSGIYTGSILLEEMTVAGA